MKHESCKPPYSTIGAKLLSSSPNGELGLFSKKDLWVSTLHIGICQYDRCTLASPWL
jgi:hypothetical protein